METKVDSIMVCSLSIMIAIVTDSTKEINYLSPAIRAGNKYVTLL